MKNSRHCAAFSLLELSIVLGIVGLILAGAMIMFSESLSVRQSKETAFKFDAIKKALYDYRASYNRIPCPADASLTLTDTNFGVEAATPGSCTGGTPAATFSQAPAVGAQDVRGGMIPTRTLRLPDEYAFDGWGRRIEYVVSKDMTQTGAFNMVTGSDTSTRITILNATGGTSTSYAIYALVSFGANGHGAYLRTGGTRLNASSANTDELKNCNCTNAAVANPTFASTFVQKDATQDSTSRFNGFDDMVSYATRTDMLMQPSLYWSVYGNGTYNCPGANLSCSTVGAIKSCVCNQ